MPQIIAALSALPVQIALVLIGIAAVVGFGRVPKDPISRKYTLWFLWACCFAVISVWTFKIQALVIGGAHIETDSQPVAVAIKGTTRYVSENLAYLHEVAWPVSITVFITFLLIYKLARVDHEA